MISETNKQGLKVVGTRPIRPDGVEKVTGRANFGADRALPGMLWGRIKRSPYALLRYTATQDVGRAIHPSYVEGQIQGGVAQGIGWALNEEYIYDKQGRLSPG